MTNTPLIVWFRQDLRLEDNPALHFASQLGLPILPLFIWNPDEKGEWAPGAASRWWLHYSLISLRDELAEMGLKLIVLHKPVLEAILDLVELTGAEQVVWNRLYDPKIIERDSKIKTELHQRGLKVKSFNGSLLYEPWTIQNKQGKPFQVFTPFWKNCLASGEPQPPLPRPVKMTGYKTEIKSETIDSLELLPKIQWDDGLKKAWKPGTAGAKEHLEFLVKHVALQYGQMRDFPGIRGTSQLSPYLHWGEISSRMIWNELRHHFNPKEEIEPFLRQLGWREFAYHLLYHFPKTPTAPLRESYSSFPWKKDEYYLTAWKRGQTGYPIVDAGMRELWQTGWMHNRVRMIVGSFLVKDLLIHWLEGARWFWDTLVDADLANNTLGWQWVGGCGADAAPYFRIFNPMTQGDKFDPNGDYVRRWIPELQKLPNRYLQRPWEAPKEALLAAGIKLGIDYPYPIVDHKIAREEALKAFHQIDKGEE